MRPLKKLTRLSKKHNRTAPTYFSLLSGIYFLMLVSSIGGCAPGATHRQAGGIQARQLSESSRQEMLSSEQQASEAVKRGDVDTAIRLYEKILEEDPTNGRIMYYLGYAYGLMGDHHSEIKYYRRAIDHNFRSAQMYYNLGEAYLGVDQVEDAVRSFEAGLGEDTDSADNHFGLGRAYHIHGRFADAEEQLIEAIRLAPEDILFKEYLGLLYEQMEQPRKAIRQYQAILEIAPESKDVRDRLEALNKTLPPSEEAAGGIGGQ
jgi:tetratricopeptide (TPR) repeat protein